MTDRRTSRVPAVVRVPALTSLLLLAVVAGPTLLDAVGVAGGHDTGDRIEMDHDGADGDNNHDGGGLDPSGDGHGSDDDMVTDRGQGHRPPDQPDEPHNDPGDRPSGDETDYGRGDNGPRDRPGGRGH